VEVLTILAAVGVVELAIIIWILSDSYGILKDIRNNTKPVEDPVKRLK